ncbi:MFS-type transporter SLC18B1-like [Amphibalanus amphitrite]|uniref:MFS-type transporter SLC18B1-like n=1 Tax=Amphibalanus amphitrite TaxID=1232801 RepID=UPI001C90B877|nr:MFS-type transporter SLC18B1-like [Amphibalanus amphitrite]
MAVTSFCDDPERKATEPLLSSSKLDYGGTQDEKIDPHCVALPEETPLVGSKSDPVAPESPSSRYTPRQKRLLAGLAVVSMLNGSLMAVMAPFFPAEAARRGVPQTAISGVYSCFALTQVVLYPLVGSLSLRVGVTRLYNAGMATAGVSTAAFGAFNYIRGGTPFIVACYVGRFVEATGTACVAACAFTIIGNQFGDCASSAVAMVTAAQSIGITVTPALAGGLYALAGFGLPFYVIGGAMIVAAVINAQFMPAVVKENNSSEGLFHMVRTFAGSRESCVCLLFVFSYMLIFLAFIPSAAPYADSVLGASPAMICLFLSVAAASCVVMSFVWAWIAERISNPYPMMAICLLLVAISQLLIPPVPWLGLQPSQWLFGLGMTMEEAVFGGAYIPCFQLMLTATVRAGLPDDLRTHAFVSSVYWTAYSLGIVAGPLAGGALVDAYGFSMMMTAVAGWAVLMALVAAAQAVAKHTELRRGQ